MQCNVCELRCNITGERGSRCNMYKCESNKIVEKFPDSFLFFFPINIETHPMLHFYPNNKFLQIGTLGCNFKCKGCVSEVLTRNTLYLSKLLIKMEPEQLVKKARGEGCIGISFGINDPIVSYFSFKKLAKVAKKNGLLVGFSSNLYFTEEALNELMPYIDFVNVGVKGFSDDIYREICRVPIAQPVFRNIEILIKNKVHVEVSVPYVKGKEKEVLNVAKFIGNLSKDIPLQIMRFIPLGEAELDLEPSIKESEDLVNRVGQYLKFVYLFNSPGTRYLDTKTENIVINREFYGPMGSHIVGFRFKKQEKSITGYINTKQKYEEDGFFGGYRITRAIEMVLGILNILGVDEEKIKPLLYKVLKVDRAFMSKFHDTLDSEESSLYDQIDIMKYLGKVSDKEFEAGLLVKYLERILNDISEKRGRIEKKVKSYFVMGHPLFAINNSRFECKLTEFVGCESVNKYLGREGKPGINVSLDFLEHKNPDIVFISGFISQPIEDFLEFCDKNNIKINAVRQNRVYRMPIGWDFGTIKWVLGLMFIANKSYPDIYKFDLEREKIFFYKTFIKSEYGEGQKNRSFYIV